MLASLRLALAATVALASVAVAQTQSGQPASAPPPPSVPAAGDVAPDFSVTATDASGKIIPVSLKDLRGKVVVLAFYPLDRSSGCTAELNKFRDEYTTLFGEGVVVYPTSIDSLGSHSSWAKEAKFPFPMIADPTGELAQKYASQAAPGRPFRRTMFVIGKDGKIAYSEARFNALAQDGYDKLAAAIKTAKAQ
jgi:thioredoxin-dependent peroxiredoxin